MGSKYKSRSKKTEDEIFVAVPVDTGVSEDTEGEGEIEFDDSSISDHIFKKPRNQVEGGFIQFIQNDLKASLKEKFKDKGEEFLGIIEQGDFKLSFIVDIRDAETWDEIKSVLRLQSALQGAVSEIYKDTKKHIEIQLELASVDLSATSMTLQNVTKNVNRKLVEIGNDFQEQAELAVREEWATHRSSEAALANAKFWFNVDCALKVGSTVVAGTSLALGTGGLGLFLAFHTVLVGTQGLYRDVIEYYKTEEKARLALEKSIAKLKKRFEESVKIKGHVVDTTSEVVLSTLLGLKVTTIKGTKKKIGDYKIKLLRISSKANEYSIRLTPLLAAYETMDAGAIMENYTKNAHENPNIAAAAEDIKTLLDACNLKDQINDVLIKISNINQDLDTGKELVKTSTDTVSDFLDAKPFIVNSVEEGLKLTLAAAKVVTGGMAVSEAGEGLVTEGVKHFLEEEAKKLDKLIPIAKNAKDAAIILHKAATA